MHNSIFDSLVWSVLLSVAFGCRVTSMMASYKLRIKEFHSLLSEDKIDVSQLRNLCFNGIPDECGYRALCWKILLNYLPTAKNDWPSLMQKQRNLYQHFIEEMIIVPGLSYKSESHAEVLEDHPLNPSPDSKWMAYFKDNEVLLQIDKDVRRLCPDISFFQQATEHPCTQIVENTEIESFRERVKQTVLSSANVTRNRMGITNISLSKKRAYDEYQYLPQGQEAHWEVVERVLFLYAKLNPGQSYVQGMNEIIGPIYYTFASDPDSEWRKYAEADCFFCFTNLMSEIRDFFIKTLDDSSSGIGSMMNRLMDLLHRHDYDLWIHLQELELCPQYYSFRWITLLLSQEFPLPDVIRVWDSLLADRKRFDFLIYVCCAMLCLLSKELLEGDFSANMKLLQNFPDTDIHLILAKAVALQS